MSQWYWRIVDDVGLIVEASRWFEQEYRDAVAEVDLATMRGTRVTEIAKRLPGIVGHRMAQLREIYDILAFLKIQEDEVRGRKRRHYHEHYNRDLSVSMVEKYVETDTDVLHLRTMANHIEHVKSMFEALSKQLEYLHFQITNVTKLIVAGVDDALM